MRVPIFRQSVPGSRTLRVRPTHTTGACVQCAPLHNSLLKAPPGTAANDPVLLSGIGGLRVCVLRLASVQLSTIHVAYEHQKQFVESHLSVTVEDFDVDSEKFNELFGDYLETA